MFQSLSAESRWGQSWKPPFHLSRASECWVSRAVQAAIEATTPIGELSGATGTHAFGPSALDGGGYDRRKAADREPYLRPDRHARRRTRVLNILRLNAFA
ncbi:MAG TPA: hypothetical protein VJ251_06365 [Stellaceae bacterium]|nr:hypothetical protein [Stellaceae bacterium]